MCSVWGTEGATSLGALSQPEVRRDLFRGDSRRQMRIVDSEIVGKRERSPGVELILVLHRQQTFLRSFDVPLLEGFDDSRNSVSFLEMRVCRSANSSTKTPFLRSSRRPRVVRKG